MNTLLINTLSMAPSVSVLTDLTVPEQAGKGFTLYVFHSTLINRSKNIFPCNSLYPAVQIAEFYFS